MKSSCSIRRTCCSRVTTRSRWTCRAKRPCRWTTRRPHRRPRCCQFWQQNLIGLRGEMFAYWQRARDKGVVLDHGAWATGRHRPCCWRAWRAAAPARRTRPPAKQSRRNGDAGPGASSAPGSAPARHEPAGPHTGSAWCAGARAASMTTLPAAPGGLRRKPRCRRCHTVTSTNRLRARGR